MRRGCTSWIGRHPTPRVDGWAIRTDTGKVRAGNEDAAAELPAGPGFRSGAVVCDGVGGAAAGEIASRIAVDHVIASLAASSGSLPERLGTAVIAANHAIREHARLKLDGAPSGSTIVAALLTDGRATLIHLGDSRAYLHREGMVEQLTSDHSFVAEQVRAGIVRPEDALAHPLRSRLVKALGIADTVAPDVREVPTRTGDVLLLCSDGLYAMASDAEIAATIGPDLAASAKALIDLANARGGKDNVTVALCRTP